MKEQILKQHLDFKRTAVKSENKIKDIERYVRMFFNFTTKPLNKFDESDLVRFINSLDTQYKIRTINDIKIYIKVFIKWHFDDYSLRFRNLDRICRSQKPEKAYSPEDMIDEKDVRKLIEGETDLVWRVYWTVFFFGGFRPSEACRLKWDEVFFEPKGIIIKTYSKKNKREFYKSLPKEVEPLLKQWKEKNEDVYLFPSPIHEGNHIKAKTVYHRLINLSKRVLNRKVVPYALRHSFATWKYNDDTLQDDDVAFQLGHSKNMKYVYTNLSKEKIRARARKLWIKPKELSPEEKNALEIKIEEMEKKHHGEIQGLQTELLEQKEFIIDTRKFLKMFKEQNKNLGKLPMTK